MPWARAVALREPPYRRERKSGGQAGGAEASEDQKRTRRRHQKETQKKNRVLPEAKPKIFSHRYLRLPPRRIQSDSQNSSSFGWISISAAGSLMDFSLPTIWSAKGRSSLRCKSLCTGGA